MIMSRIWGGGKGWIKIRIMSGSRIRIGVGSPGGRMIGPVLAKLGGPLLVLFPHGVKEVFKIQERRSPLGLSQVAAVEDEHLVSGLGLLEFVVFPIPLLLGQPLASGLMVVATQLSQLAEDLAQALPALTRVGGFLEEGLAGANQLDGQERGEAVAEGHTASHIAKILGLVSQVLDQLAGFLVAEPVLVAALFPLGEVLLVDGAAVEVESQDPGDAGVVIEPLDDLDARFAVLKAKV